MDKIEEKPWTPPPGQYHPREAEAVSPPPPTEQSLPETTLESELESMMDEIEMEAGQASHHAADPTPTPTPSVPTPVQAKPVFTPQPSAPATPQVPDPEASPPTEGQTEKTDDGEDAEEEKERNDKACFFGDMVNLQYALYTSAYPLIKTQCRLPGRCEAIFDHAIDWDWTNPNNQRFSSSWARWKATTCDLLHGVSSPCARYTYYIYIYIYFIYFSNIIEHNICRGQRIDP